MQEFDRSGVAAMHRRLLPVAFPIFLAGLVLPLACQKPGALVVSADPDLEGPPIFADVTVSSQVLHIYRNGEEADQFSILETLGGGVALIDYDGDGLVDIFFTGGGRFTGPNRERIEGAPCRLFRNLGNWRFEDVTEKVGLAGP